MSYCCLVKLFQQGFVIADESEDTSGYVGFVGVFFEKTTELLENIYCHMSVLLTCFLEGSFG